jgi:hypothetical protein
MSQPAADLPPEVHTRQCALCGTPFPALPEDATDDLCAEHWNDAGLQAVEAAVAARVKANE